MNNIRLLSVDVCREWLLKAIRAGHRNQRGSTLIAVVLVSLLLLLALGGSLVTAQGSLVRTNGRVEAVLSFYVANAGIEEVISKIRSDPTWQGNVRDTMNGYNVEVSTYVDSDHVIGIYSTATGAGSTRYTIRATYDTAADKLLTWVERTL